MKTLTIYKREVTARTGFRKYAFKSEIQYIVTFDGKERKNCFEYLDNPKLRVKFYPVLKTRSYAKAAAFAQSLDRTNSGKWLKQNLEGLGVLTKGAY